MNLKFRKKSPVIQAWQFTRKNYIKGIPSIFISPKVYFYDRRDIEDGFYVLVDSKLRDKFLKAQENDWLIRLEDGDFDVCNNEDFLQEYEMVNESN